MSRASVLSGSLEEFRLVELLQMMGMGATTGALHLRHADGRSGLIYFERGALVSCSEHDTEALTLGHVLQQLNLVSAPQLDHTFHLQKQDPLGKRIGERLVDMQVLTKEQLQTALRTQALWTARELALWHEGQYEFHPGERLPQASETHIETMNVVMEVLRYEHEWESLGPFLPNGMRTQVAMVYEPPLGHPLTFHTSAWRVITRVNAHRTVRRVATALRTPEVEVARMIGPLVREGLLAPVGAAGGPGLPEEARQLSMNNFDLFTLLISMEQDWLKRKTPADQLVALASFINQTMRTLEEACQHSGLSLATDTLAKLLTSEGVTGVGDYTFHIERNRVDEHHFAAYCRRVFEGAPRDVERLTGDSATFYAQARETLLRALEAAFQAINARVALPNERAQNQEAWRAFFQTMGAVNATKPA